MYLEQTYIAKNGIKVRYKHKKSKYDFNHIIFVFSGFLNAKPGNYDFANALNDCPCDVVWIGDNFEEMYTYYLCVNMDFKVENAVTEFIHHMLGELNLSLNQATTTGFSKGGSAALYYGLKLNFPNIVITVPQLKIGSYVNNRWKHVAKHMMGEYYNSVNITFLDNLLPRLLKQDRKLERNIYLLTSESDEQYKTEIKPYLLDFAKYNNFNLLKSYSVFVRTHNQVTNHHTALLLGIYYALATEATPRYNNGEVNFFGSQLFGNPNPSGEPYVDLRVLKLDKERLFIDGVALLRGYDAADYSDLDYVLILKNNKREDDIQLPLAKGNQPNLTRSLFDGKYLTIYDKSVFTTLRYEGVDLSELPKGIYQMFIQIKMHKYKEVSAEQPIVAIKQFDEVKAGRYCVYQDENKAFWLNIK